MQHRTTRQASDPAAEDQRTRTAVRNKEILDKLPEDAKAAMKSFSKTHASDWLTSCSKSKNYQLALQTRIRWQENPTLRRTCDCGAILESAKADEHAIGCTRLHGANASSRHAAVRDTINKFCRVHGFPSQIEPAISGGLRADLLLCFGPSAPLYVDIVLPNPLCASHRGKSSAELEKEKDKLKQGKYSEAVRAIGGELCTFVVETTGGFSMKAAAIVRELERDCGAEGELFKQIAETIMHWNGAIISNARRPKQGMFWKG